MKVPFVTVESDRFFLKAVEKAIHDRGLAGPSQEFRHADLGLTTAWGRPVFPQPLTTGMRQKFSRYSDLPVHVTQASEAPDLILVDGRFRVACALKFLLRFGRYENWWMAVDDFEVRDDYAVICNFAHLERLAGRMAIFKSSRKYRS